MNFVANDICYMIETGKIVKVKVMRKQGNTYIVQRIGACGALTLSEKELFPTEKDAANSKKSFSIVNMDITD